MDMARKNKTTNNIAIALMRDYKVRCHINVRRGDVHYLHLIVPDEKGKNVARDVVVVIRANTGELTCVMQGAAIQHEATTPKEVYAWLKRRFPKHVR